jgi:hypothetical protein
MIFPGETETDNAIKANIDGIDIFIYRSFFDFDLSSIPASATIISCTLTLENYGTANCDASIQEGTQGDSLAPDDYSAFTGLFFDTLTWATGSNVFTLNAAGLIYVQSVFESTAKFCMREYDHDYLDAAPANGEDFHAGLYWSGAAFPSNRPILTVQYKS